MTKNITPIFLLGLPRSGSTLVQRILSSHSEIDTFAEPSILLPYVYATKFEGVTSEYAHRTITKYINDFCENLPGGLEGYYESLRVFIEGLYSKSCDKNGASFFLDKTPRYSLIGKDILKIFPNAKFIVLFRHPLSVVASNNETFASGKWYAPNQRAMLFSGLNEIIQITRDHADKVHVVNYESLIDDSETIARRLCDYLGIEFESDMLVEGPKSILRGIAGDPTGTKEYKSLSSAPKNKWKANLSNIFRKRWCTQYVNWIGECRLKTMGYSYTEIIQEIENNKTSTYMLGSDLIRFPLSYLYTRLQLPAVIQQLRRYKTKRSEEIHAYY